MPVPLFVEGTHLLASFLVGRDKGRKGMGNAAEELVED
jgi:hypothetical protein